MKKNLEKIRVWSILFPIELHHFGSPPLAFFKEPLTGGAVLAVLKNMLAVRSHVFFMFFKGIAVGSS